MKSQENIKLAEIAAFYIQCGSHGHNLNNVSPAVINGYSIRIKYHSVFLFAAWSLLVLHFFERPIWSYEDSVSSNWSNLAIFPGYGLSLCPLSISIPFSAIFLMILAVASYLDYQYEDHSIFKISISKILILLVFFKSMENFVNICVLASGGTSFVSFSPVEAFILLLIESRYATNVIYLCHTLPMFGSLILVLAVAVCLYTSLGLLFFEPDSTERIEYFNTFGQGLWNMLMVLCASNWPSPLIPAYNENRIYFLYFMVYLITFNWGILNFLLGYVCRVYRDEQRTLSLQFEMNRHDNLRKAFVILDINNDGNLDIQLIELVLTIIHTKYELHLFPISDEEKTALITHLKSSSDNSDMLSLRFRQFINIHKCFNNESLQQLRENVRVERHISVLLQSRSLLPLMEICSGGFRLFLNLNYSEQLLVLHAMCFQPLYDFVIDLIMLGLGIIFLLTDYEGVTITMIVFQLIDLLIKLTALASWREFFHSRRRRFDSMFCMIVIAVLIAKDFSTISNLDDFLIEAIILIRIVALPRSILFLDIFKEHRNKLSEAFQFLLLGSKSFSFLVLLLFLMMYVFGGIGLHIFGGVIRKEGWRATVLSNNVFGIQGYWPLSMNDLFSSVVTMFILLHVNNTHVIASGYVSVTSTWAKLFFAVWYIVGVLLLLNILTALFLTGFFQYLKSISVAESSDSLVNNNIEYQNENALLTSTPIKAPQNRKDNDGLQSPNVFTHNNLQSSQTTPVCETGLVRHMINKAHERSMGKEKSGTKITDYFDVIATDDEDTKDVIEVLSKQYEYRSSMIVPSENDLQGSDVQSEQFTDWVSERLQRFSHSIFASPDVRSSLSDRLKTSYSLRQRLLPPSQTVDRISHTPTWHALSNPRSSQLTSGTQNFPSYNSIGRAYKRDEGTEAPPSMSVQLERLYESEEALLSSDYTYDSHSSSERSILDINKHLDIQTHIREYTWCEQLYDCIPSFDWIRGEEEMQPYEAAAALVQYAREGVEYSLFSSRRALSCFRLRHKLSTLFQFICWANLFLSLFQRPAWTYSENNWDDKTVYPMSGTPFMPQRVTCGLYLIFLSIILFGLLLEFGYQEEAKLNSVIFTLSDVIRAILTVFCIAQLIVTLVVFTSNNNDVLSVWSSLASMIYIFFFDYHSRWKLELIICIIPKLSVILFGYLLVVLTFASFGPFVFNISPLHDDDDYNQKYFSTFPQSIWSVFIVVTSSSFPDQVMPLYREYRAFAIYFFLIVSIGAFGALNLILVFVLSEYRKGLQVYSDRCKTIRGIFLLKAFDQLDVDRKHYLTYAQIAQLMKELYTHYGDFRKAGIPSDRKQGLLVKILDIDGDGKISLEDFSFFIDVTRIKIKQTSDRTYFQTHFPSMTKSAAFMTISKIYKSKEFDHVIDSIVVALIVWRLSISPSILGKPIEVLIPNTILFIVLLLELVGHLIVDGLKGYLKTESHRINGVLSMTYILSIIVTFYWYSTTSTNEPVVAVFEFISQILRLVLFPRILLYFFPDKINIAVQLLRRILRRMFTLAIVFFWILFLFGIIGVSIFGGTMSLSPSSSNYNALISSDYGKNNYYDLNFNDLTSALVTLFCCLHVSDFDVITEGFVVVTNKYARLYFLAWYIFGVLLLLNMIKSFFLTEFLPAVVATLKNQDESMNNLQHLEESSPYRNHSIDKLKSVNNPQEPLLDLNPMSESITPIRTNISADLSSTYKTSTPIPVEYMNTLDTHTPIDGKYDDPESFSFIVPSPLLGRTPRQYNVLDSIQTFTLYSNPSVDSSTNDVDHHEGTDDVLSRQETQQSTADISGGEFRGEDNIQSNVNSPLLKHIGQSPVKQQQQKRKQHDQNDEENVISTVYQLPPTTPITVVTPSRHDISTIQSSVTSPPSGQDYSGSSIPFRSAFFLPDSSTTSISGTGLGSGITGGGRKYEASTEFVKDLSAHDLQLLHDRLRQLASEGQINDDDENKDDTTKQNQHENEF